MLAIWCNTDFSPLLSAIVHASPTSYTNPSRRAAVERPCQVLNDLPSIATHDFLSFAVPGISTTHQAINPFSQVETDSEMMHQTFQVNPAQPHRDLFIKLYANKEGQNLLNVGNYWTVDQVNPPRRLTDAYYVISWGSPSIIDEKIIFIPGGASAQDQNEYCNLEMPLHSGVHFSVQAYIQPI